MSASERRITALEEENRRLKHLLEKHLNTAYEMTMESGVSSKTGEAFVMCRWGDEMGQLTPDQVREHAIKLVECAAAAEFDAALVRAVTGGDGSDPDLPQMTYDHAVAFLSLIRASRGAPSDGSAKAAVGE